MNILSYLFPRPAFWAYPDMSNRSFGGITNTFIAFPMGENKEVPRVGDIVAHLESDSMGMGVDRDTRWRVVGPGPYKQSVEGVNEAGQFRLLHVFYMCRDKKLPRFWWLYE